jgi:hypothetical protein
MKFKDLLSGFIRLHVLHHAAEHEHESEGETDGTQAKDNRANRQG